MGCTLEDVRATSQRVLRTHVVRGSKNEGPGTVNRAQSGFRFRPAFELSALSRIAVKGGGISGLIHCRSRVTCAGALEVVGLAGRLRGARKPPVLARSRVFDIAPRKSHRVRATLTRTGRRVLKRGRTVRARLKVTSIRPSGKAVTRSFKVRLRR